MSTMGLELSIRSPQFPVKQANQALVTNPTLANVELLGSISSLLPSPFSCLELCQDRQRQAKAATKEKF